MIRVIRKFRVSSSRAQWWDYSKAADYFITINTGDGCSYFGEIQDGLMVSSKIGQIALDEWRRTFGLRLDMNLEMGAFQIMPDHIHGIISIRRNQFNAIENTQGSRQKPKNGFKNQSKNLGSILGGFKSTVTRQAIELNPRFNWQERFHDHIIRDEKEYQRIETYIKNNPAKWKS